ncbi:MAG: hypothetical protein UV40_C0014G0018, partial [Parcubacteria group bacterium GW2011_GWA1_42_7]
MKDYIKQNWRNLTISILVIGFVLLMIFSNSPIDKQDNSAQPSATPLPETSLQNNQTNSSDIFIKTKEECGKYSNDRPLEKLGPPHLKQSARSGKYGCYKCNRRENNQNPNSNMSYYKERGKEHKNNSGEHLKHHEDEHLG